MSSRKDAVFAAADSIESQGNKATLEAVRVITGGSYSTLVPLMQEWRIQREADRAAREPAPDEIVNQFTAMAHDLWTAASAIAQKQLAVEKESLKAERELLLAEHKEVIDVADQLTVKVTGLGAANAELMAQVGQLQNDLNSETGVRQAGESKVQTLQAQLEEKEHRATDLRAEVDRLHAETKLASEIRQKSIEEAARLRGQIEAQQAQYAQLLQTIKKAT